MIRSEISLLRQIRLISGRFRQMKVANCNQISSLVAAGYTTTPISQNYSPLQREVKRYLSTSKSRNPPEYDSMFADRDDDYGLKRKVFSKTVDELKKYASMRRNKEEIPKEVLNRLRGIVIEDASALTGISAVAAYDDGTACFYNGRKYYASSSQDDEFLERIIANLFHFTEKEIPKITQYVKDEERNGPVPLGSVRVTLLTASGLRRAEYASYNEMFDVITAGTDLGLYLILNGT